MTEAVNTINAVFPCQGSCECVLLLEGYKQSCHSGDMLDNTSCSKPTLSAVLLIWFWKCVWSVQTG